MVDDKTIQSAVARLVCAATSPSQVILSGSYALVDRFSYSFTFWQS